MQGQHLPGAQLDRSLICIELHLSFEHLQADQPVCFMFDHFSAFTQCNEYNAQTVCFKNSYGIPVGIFPFLFFPDLFNERWQIDLNQGRIYLRSPCGRRTVASIYFSIIFSAIYFNADLSRII
jgi:hypothetical protein